MGVEVSKQQESEGAVIALLSEGVKLAWDSMAAPKSQNRA